MIPKLIEFLIANTGIGDEGQDDHVFVSRWDTRPSFLRAS
jgi:hypothetical protein